jgi:hypothetical protein
MSDGGCPLLGQTLDATASAAPMSSLGNALESANHQLPHRSSETNMLRAVGEGEQSDMTRFASVELLHSPGEQCLGNATLLQIRSYGERTKETNAAPFCGKVRAG